MCTISACQHQRGFLMASVRTVAYLPKKVSEEMKKYAENYSSESAYIVEAVREKNAREKKK